MLVILEVLAQSPAERIGGQHATVRLNSPSDMRECAADAVAPTRGGHPSTSRGPRPSNGPIGRLDRTRYRDNGRLRPVTRLSASAATAAIETSAAGTRSPQRFEPAI